MASRAKAKERYSSMVATAAYQWWMGKRPAGMSKAEHVKNPAVNCAGINECNLAMMVAKLAEFRD